MEPFVCRHPNVTIKFEARDDRGSTISMAGPYANPALVEILLEEEAIRLRDWLLARYPVNPS